MTGSSINKASLVVVEHDAGIIKPSTLNTIQAAVQLGGDIDLLVVGVNGEKQLESAQQIAGIRHVLWVMYQEGVSDTAEFVASAILQQCNHYDSFLAPATAYGKNIMPRVAAGLDVAQISDVLSIEKNDTDILFTRPIYAGNAIATVRSLDAKKVLTVRTTAFDAVAVQGGQASVKELSISPITAQSKVVKRELTVSARPELTAAKVVVSGGRALGSKENFALLDALADKLNAAVGASRAAVDAGYAPNDWQVGQTGKIVAPQLYIAVGISGAIQHLAGMKDSKVIVAINKDPDAPILSVADYGLVADLFEAVPALTKLL